MVKDDVVDIDLFDFVVVLVCIVYGVVYQCVDGCVDIGIGVYIVWIFVVQFQFQWCQVSF